MSLTEFVRDPVRVESLRRGVAVMKARPASDHRSWFFQAAIHAYDDALYADALAQDPNVAQVDRARYWNKCTHFGQSSANFVIWHRAYLYYFERILRDAAGDPESRTAILGLYERRQPGLPGNLSRTNMSIARSESQSALSFQSRSRFRHRHARHQRCGRSRSGYARQRHLLFRYRRDGICGRYVLGEDETQVGLLEQRPHNDIHLAVGGVVGTANGAMADVRTAAFDPVFWVHHANIDRMWAEWSRTRGKRLGCVAARRMARRKCVDLSRCRRQGEDKQPALLYRPRQSSGSLRYRRHAGCGACIAGSAAAATASSAHRSAPLQSSVGDGRCDRPWSKRRHRNGRVRSYLAENNPIDVSPSSPERARARVALPPTEALAQRRRRNRIFRQPAIATAEAPPSLSAPPIAPNERVLLELSDIHFDRVPSSGFAVYLIEGRANARANPWDCSICSARRICRCPAWTMKAAQRFDVTRIVGAFRRARSPCGSSLTICWCANRAPPRRSVPTKCISDRSGLWSSRREAADQYRYCSGLNGPSCAMPI
jgi:hypothetical protein